MSSLTQQTINTRIEALPAELKGDVSVMSLRGDVLFDPASSDLGKNADSELDSVATFLKNNPDSPIVIRSYTDSAGSEQDNLLITQKRADAVGAWLTKKLGTSSKNITAIGMGASEPVAPNTNFDGTDNIEGRSKNRRIAIAIPAAQDSINYDFALPDFTIPNFPTPNLDSHNLDTPCLDTHNFSTPSLPAPEQTAQTLGTTQG